MQPKGVSCDKRADQIKKGALKVIIPPPAALVEVQEEDLSESEEDVDESPREIRDDP
jgi:hypothetical protein